MPSSASRIASRSSGSVHDAPIDVRPTSSAKDERAFLEFPYTLYADDPVYVPPLRMAERDLQSRKKNPFFQHATAQHFLARRGGQVVGRIAAIENPRHNKFHEDRVGFFGFFDAVPDERVAKALVDAAASWCAARGLEALRGPANYSTNDSCGVLVDGFDESPTLMMPYNRPDYAALLEASGLQPVKDLVAMWIPTRGIVPERFQRVVGRRMARTGTTLRPIDFGNFAAEVATIKDLYNRCWEKNWGFVPATDAEFDHAAKDLKMVLCPHLSCMAMRDGEAVGFSVFLRDLNEILKPLRGRLFPFGWWKLLRGIKRIGKRRCVLLGVVPEARGSAINEAFFIHALETAPKIDCPGAEAGWVLEDNKAMIAPIEAAGGHVAKRYRMFEMPLEGRPN